VDDLANIGYEQSWPYICDAIQKQLCPTAQEDPMNLILNMSQVHRPSDGSGDVRLSVHEYFTGIQSMTNFFQEETWPMDVVHHFIQHLEYPIRTAMTSAGHTYDTTAAGARSAHTQIINLQIAYAAATQAEISQLNIRDMAKEVVSGHAFLSQVQTLASIAETTIDKYGGGAGQGRKEEICWGCNKKGHKYANRDGTILCPDTGDPAVRAHADKARADFNARLEASHKKKRKDNKRGNGTTSNNAEASSLMDSLSNLSKAELIAVLVSRADDKAAQEKRAKTVAFTIAVLTVEAGKKLLPAMIDSNLPHFSIILGSATSPATYEFLVAIATLFDTGSAINIGRLDFHLAVAKRFPAIVKSLFWAKDEYSPIVLSGVISAVMGTDRASHRRRRSKPSLSTSCHT
jgi:hypothetical protein